MSASPAAVDGKCVEIVAGLAVVEKKATAAGVGPVLARTCHIRHIDGKVNLQRLLCSTAPSLSFKVALDAPQCEIAGRAGDEDRSFVATEVNKWPRLLCRS